METMEKIPSKPTDDPEKARKETLDDMNSNTTSKNANLVTFTPNDPEDPRNWALWRKYSIVIALTIANFSALWNASGYTPAQMIFKEEFGTSTEVAVLPLTLYVIGLAIRPMLLVPLSEYFGRSPVYLVNLLLTCLFLMATVLVPTTGGFLILRFITGFFSSASISKISMLTHPYTNLKIVFLLANIGGTIADTWDHNYTDMPLAIYTITAAGSSPSRVFVFSFIAQLHGLRAVFWGMMGCTGGFFILLLVVLKKLVIVFFSVAEPQNHANKQKITNLTYPKICMPSIRKSCFQYRSCGRFI